MLSRATRLSMLVLAVLAASTAAPAAAEASAYGVRTLKQGARGSDVKVLQRLLTEVGHSVSADGVFGSRTTRALMATETELELRANGVATRTELRAIRKAVSDPGDGGATYVAPPEVDEVVPGAKGRVTGDGFALPPESAPASVKAVIAAGNKIAKTPYKWGGGHGTWKDTGYDCSGSVSYALHAGNLLDNTLVSGDFARWGARGRGAWISVYANAGHVYMVVAGLRFDTSARSQTGSRWTTQMRPSSGYTVTHPEEL
jgi:cell wall-associated NlpC family hydrolase